MKIKRMVKRLFAVGTGVAMIGATAMGAVAAADLKDYPNFLVKDGVFDGYVVVGEKAAAIDNLAAIDITTSMKVAKAVDTAKKVTTVEGDSWLAGTSSKKFEMSNNNATDTAITGESVRDITTFIGDDELDALKDGTWSTNEQSYDYQQFLFFDADAVEAGLVSANRIVKYAENDEDKTADHFFIKNGRQIARYRLEFTSTAQSDVTDSTGSADTTGTYLDDFENTDISFFGKPYTVVLARRPASAATGAQNSIRMVLMAGSAHDTVLESETKSYTVGDKSYEVTLSYVDDDEAKFIVNGEATNKLKVGETYVLKDKSEVGVSEILYQSYAGGVHSATFFVGAQKLELRDDDVTASSAGGNAIKIGSESIDGSNTIISGSDNNVTFSVSTIEVNMTAQDDFFVGAGQKLSDQIAKEEEKEVLFTNSWDVSYNGLTTDDMHQTGLKTSSSKRYHLHLFDGDGKEVELPVAYADGSGNLSIGEESWSNVRTNQKRLIFIETGGKANDTSSGAFDVPRSISSVYKDDYFIVTSGDSSSGAAKSYLLQYKGSDAQTKTGPKIKFRNMGSGETLEYSVTSQTAVGTVATIKLGGYSFLVQNASVMTADDFQVNVDLDGSGAVSDSTAIGVAPVFDKQVNFTDSYGQTWGFANVNSTVQGGSAESFVIQTQTKNVDDYDNVVPVEVNVNITASSDPEVRLSTLSGFTLVTPDGKTDVSYGYTSMGTFVTLKAPSSDPQELLLDYPKDQVLPQVYFTAQGATTKTATAKGDLVAVAVVDATKLDSEVADAKAQNLIVVGGPCVNSVAAELLGNPTNCAEGFTAGKARIKLVENGGKVAMLVAGYSGADTRLAGKVLAHKGDMLSGMEVEVEGTTYSDATISAPSKVVAAPVKVEAPVVKS